MGGAAAVQFLGDWHAVQGLRQPDAHVLRGGRPSVAALDVAPQVRDLHVSPGMQPARRHRDDVVNGRRQSAGRTGRGVDKARPVLADAAIAVTDFLGGEGLDRACLPHQVPAPLALRPQRGTARLGSTGDATHAASPKRQGSAREGVSAMPRPVAWPTSIQT